MAIYVMEMTIIDFLNDQMQKRDVGVRGFAKEIGVSHATISEILSGKQGVTLEFLIKVAKATQIDLCTLVAFVAPNEARMSAKAALMAQEISQLPPDKQAFIDDILMGMVTKRRDNHT
jgi:plasmid maintenance system antidote protein VapI